MQAEISYVPFAQRPEPYPAGYAPNPTRWSGRELVRVEMDPTADRHVLPSGVPPCTPMPIDPDVITARTSQRTRYVPTDRLPARRTVLLEHITDDPGALAIHGQRLWQDVPATETEDGWTSQTPRIVELPIGGVLVSAESENDGTRHWRTWRVTPIGPPVLVLAEKTDPGDRAHLPKLAALLDEELQSAFADILARYARSGARPEHIRQMSNAIEHWAFGEVTRRPKSRRRRRTMGAEPAEPTRGTRPRLVACA